MIAQFLITDGRRECLERTVASAADNLVGPISERWMFDDTGDEEHRAWLKVTYPDFTHINGGPRLGFGGAIRTAWEYLDRHSDTPFVFHLEQDFVFNRLVNLQAMAATLGRHPHLAQMALRRQPWSAAEREAGGVVEQWPEEYEDCAGGGLEWLEHRMFWTSNPCLYRRELMAEGWPRGEQSERAFTHQLMSEGFDGIPGDEVRCGYWGARGSGEAVTHIGHERVGVGY